MPTDTPTTQTTAAATEGRIASMLAHLRHFDQITTEDHDADAITGEFIRRAPQLGQPLKNRLRHVDEEAAHAFGLAVFGPELVPVDHNSGAALDAFTFGAVLLEARRCGHGDAAFDLLALASVAILRLCQEGETR